MLTATCHRRTTWGWMRATSSPRYCTRSAFAHSMVRRS